MTRTDDAIHVAAILGLFAIVGGAIMLVGDAIEWLLLNHGTTGLGATLAVTGAVLLIIASLAKGHLDTEADDD